MYHGNNPAALRSQKAIIVAFNQMLKEQPFQNITIKELMIRTGLSRPTFYKMFTSLDEIITFQLNQLFTDYVQKTKITEIKNLCDASTVFFSFFEQNQAFISTLIINNKSCLLQTQCSNYLNDDAFVKFLQPPNTTTDEKPAVVSFITAGIIGLANEWVQEPTKYTPTELANLVCRLTGQTDNF